MIREISGFFNEFGVGLFERASEKIIKKVSTSKLLATAFGRDGEWAVFTPGGRYDKSAAVQAHYVQGMRSFALDEVESAKRKWPLLQRYSPRARHQNGSPSAWRYATQHPHGNLPPVWNEDALEFAHLGSVNLAQLRFTYERRRTRTRSHQGGLAILFPEI